MPLMRLWGWAVLRRSFFFCSRPGIVEQDAPKKFIRILEETVHTDGASFG